MQPPRINPHICNKPYSEVDDLNQDLADLVTCQRHTRCSAAYYIYTHNGQQKCRFGYPKPLQPETTLVTEDGEPALFTKRNDGLRAQTDLLWNDGHGYSTVIMA